MEMERYRIETKPKCPADAMVCGKHYRISVLTGRLLRLEYSEDGVFEDRATQIVLCREFPHTEFKVVRKNGRIELFTDSLHLSYDEGPFSAHGLRISAVGGQGNRLMWRFGMELHSIGGTARTLDGADGAIPLEPGLFSHEGYGVIDDSRSLALTEDGWVAPRCGGQDFYFFGYGGDFEAGLKDFYRLTGPQPLLPRYVFGNWWSRYHRYDEAEYLELMERFQREQLPFTVAVVDMDWHLVDIDPKYGTGWTGYTWNRQLFPDPRAFAKRLHDKGLHLTLNVHPADGIRAHEDCYRAAAEAMGLDPAAQEPIDFDAADPHFMRVYFDAAHHPLEEDGVDFWWVDWQQGTETALPGLDPLWILNHYHYLDSRRHGRPLTFTRYAGPGSHRYPVGFSGDTYITWDSLRFQPYFTSAASCIGFGWWSHDIGGHMGGARDDELAARWVQFGVFSPIFRLHSTSNAFSGKEPWNFGPEAREVMNRFIRLRHTMIPYLYSMNHDAHTEDRPLIRPLYWYEPDNRRLYSEELRNAYYFGTELLVAPVTERRDPTAQMAKTASWLPEGLWFDVFTGFAYRGGRVLDFYRPLGSIPVFAKAGGIVPLQGKRESWNDVSNPEAVSVHVYPGADGLFTLWEDEDQAEDAAENWARTDLALHWGGKAASFVIGAAQGNLAAIPAKREWKVCIHAVRDAQFRIQGAAGMGWYDASRRELTVLVEHSSVTGEICIEFPEGLCISENPVSESADAILMQAQIAYDEKTVLSEIIAREKTHAAGEVWAAATNETVRGALLELLTAYDKE